MAVVHTLLFSMSGDEWKRSNFQDGDYQNMIRNVMKDWQLEKGIKVSWVGAEHNEEGHPHIHVSIKAVFQDSDGVTKRLKIDPEDKKFMKNAFQQEKNRIRGFELETRSREYSRSKHHEKEPQFGKQLFNNLVNQINQRLREEEFKREMAKDFDR